MNLILFQSPEEAVELRPDDPRTKHIREVLRLGVDDRFYVGVVNGPRGLAEITSEDEEGGLKLSVTWDEETPRHLPITLLVGLSRPQTARRMLFEAACMAVWNLVFFRSEKGEPSYASSSLWASAEWRDRLWQGAEQGFHTLLPRVRHAGSLEEAIQVTAHQHRAANIALDLYEAGTALKGALPPAGQVCLALGPERGWSALERDILREAGFTLAHLGPAVLRSETALVSAVSLAASRLGAWDHPWVPGPEIKLEPKLPQ